MSCDGKQMETLIQQDTVNETLESDIREAASQGDYVSLENAIDQCPNETKDKYTAVAIAETVKNNDNQMMRNLLLQYKVSSKTSSKLNQLNNTLVCLYECIDKNNAVLTNMIVNSMINDELFDGQGENPFDDIFKRAFNQGCESNIIRTLDRIWRRCNKQNSTLELLKKYNALLSGLLNHDEADKEDLGKMCLYTLMKHGLLEFDKDVFQLIHTHFPAVEHKLQSLKEYLKKRMPTDPDTRKYYFEYLFSKDDTSDSYKSWHIHKSQLSSRHSFSKLPEKHDYTIQQNIIQAVDSNLKDENALDESCKVQEAVDSFMKNLCNVVNHREKWLTVERTLVGSSFENTRVFSPNEYDFFLAFLELSAHFEITFLDSFVIYVLKKGLTPMQKIKDLLDEYDGQFFLNPDRLKYEINETIRGIMRDDVRSIWKPLQNSPQIQTGMCNVPDGFVVLCDDSRLSIDPIGYFTSRGKFATISLIWRGIHYKHLPITIDIVPGFMHEHSRFELLNHNYLKDNVKLHIVAYGSPIGFQMNPTLHEGNILRAIPKEIRLGYQYAKAMRRTSVLQNTKSKTELQNINNYEDTLTSYMLKQSVLALTQNADKLKERSYSNTSQNDECTAIQWTKSMYEQLREFLVNHKRIPQIMCNPDNIEGKECVFKLDFVHFNVRNRELKCIVAMIDRILEVLNAQVT